jgi:N-acetylneuraminate lyase
MMTRLHGLTAATHTPFEESGALNLDVVELQAEHLARNRITAAFVGGTTGECHSLTLDERMSLAKRWREATRDSALKVVIHVGSNCLADSRSLAAQAESLGAFAIAAVSPSYFKPSTLEDLIDCCQMIAAAAPQTPFYYYDIPSMTGVQFPTHRFLERAADRIPTLVGVKYSNSDMMTFQRCLNLAAGRFDVPWGIDEWLLAALALGASGAVGSSYNFAAPLFHRMIGAFQAGDLDAARTEQFRAAQLIQTLDEFGYMAAARYAVEFLGVPIGPPRLPFSRLTGSRAGELSSALENAGLRDW